MKITSKDLDHILSRDGATLHTERDALKAELAEALADIVCSDGSYEKDGPKKGYYDSMALSHVCAAGDRLVELGLWKRHPGGYGRRWWYRPGVRDAMPHHGAIGRVIVAGRGKPRNHMIVAGFTKVVVPCGNLRNI